jgi:hypothetical protein
MQRLNRVEQRGRRTPGLLLLIAVLLPVSAGAQNNAGVAIGVGLGRLLPVEPLATADGQDTEYRLAGAATSVFGLEFWPRDWYGARVSYQWLRTDLSEPDGPSFARLYSGYVGLLLAPVLIARITRPYLVVGAGLRRYDVNARVTTTGGNWDIAPTQNRVAGYGGVGVMVRLGGLYLVPEAAVFSNSFQHQFPCETCSNQRDSQLDMLLSVQLQLRGN